LPDDLRKMHIIHRLVLSLLAFLDHAVFQLTLRNDLYCVGWGIKLYSLTHFQLTRRVSTNRSVDRETTGDARPSAIIHKLSD